MAIVAAMAELLQKLSDLRARYNGDGMTAWLYTNDHTPTAYDDLTDYSPTTVDGVAGRPVTWPSAPTDEGDGTARLQGAYLQWTPTGTTTSQTIIGFYVVNNDTGAFQFGQRFTTPVVGFGADLEPIVTAPAIVERSIP